MQLLINQNKTFIKNKKNWNVGLNDRAGSHLPQILPSNTNDLGFACHNWSIQRFPESCNKNVQESEVLLFTSTDLKSLMSLNQYISVSEL